MHKEEIIILRGRRQSKMPNGAPSSLEKESSHLTWSLWGGGGPGRGKNVQEDTPGLPAPLPTKCRHTPPLVNAAMPRGDEL